MSPPSQKESSKISSCIVFDIGPFKSQKMIFPSGIFRDGHMSFILSLSNKWLVFMFPRASCFPPVGQLIKFYPLTVFFVHLIWGYDMIFFSFWSLLGPKWEWKRSLELCLLHRKEKQGEIKAFGIFIIAGVSRWQLKLNGLVLRIIYR